MLNSACSPIRSRHRRSIAFVIAAWLLAAIAPCAADAIPLHPRGSTQLVAGHWFQYLGREVVENDPHDLWLYPHLDGVHEIFTAPTVRANRVDPEDRLWRGMLGTQFDPDSGRFGRRFAAVEVLNEFLDSNASRRQRERAVRLLDLFVELSPVETPPYYLRYSASDRWDRYRNEENRAWVAERVARHRALTEELPHLGPRLFAPPTDPTSSDDFYRAMIADGYLDIAVVGGNSRDEETGKVYSWNAIEELRQTFGREGYTSIPLRTAEDTTVDEKTVRLLGRSVRVRIRSTGGSHRKPRIRRTVANFIDGLAYADVVIYQGHSNKYTGSYYLSESKSAFSRFRLGMGNQRDLDRKCHSVLTKPYQIIALQSCYSYDKYCSPIRAHCDREYAQRGGRAGFLGTAEICYFLEFVPRFSAFIQAIVKGEGPRAISRRVNSLRPVRDAAPLIFRGLLQASRTFIVPPSVTIDAIDELGTKRGFLVHGTGSDGEPYVSTEVFTQDALGDIVQVVARKRGAYGLGRDGRVYYAGHETGGVTTELTTTRDSGLEFVFMAYAERRERRPRLFLIARSGELYYLAKDRDRLVRPTWQTTGLVAVGNDTEGVFIGRDAAGTTLALERGEWTATASRPFVNVTPHLDQGARIWRPSPSSDDPPRDQSDR